MDEASSSSPGGGGPGTRPRRARVGDVLLGKWRLDKMIAVGGMASVYAATHRFGRRAALKILHAMLALDEEVRERFLREGYVANQVRHPGAVEVLDLDATEDGAPFLVMELLEGETLDDRWVRTGPMAADEVLQMADLLLDVLAAAHDAGVVHRDLKPENVMMLPDGRIKVLDFGIASMREVQLPGEPTDTGLMMGTPAFMPPEQMRAQWSDVDARSDLWAVGALMFALVSGRYVHQRESTADMMIACATEQAPSLATVAEVPVELIDVVDRALAFERCDRYQDARSMQRAVRAARRAIHGRASAAWADPLAYAATDDGSTEIARMLCESGSHPAQGGWYPSAESSYRPAESTYPPADSGSFPVESASYPPAPPFAGEGADAQDGERPRSRSALSRFAKIVLAGGTAAIALATQLALVGSLAGRVAAACPHDTMTAHRTELAAR